jgi:hypothetical protein
MAKAVATGRIRRGLMFVSPQMSESLDRWITGNYGEDGWLDEEDIEEFDPRYDEPLDFGEE